MPEAAVRRVFFALWPDAAGLDALDALAGLAAERGGGRRMRRDSLHMTLAFIGAATPGQLDLLHAVAGRVAAFPFEVRLDRLGWWPQKRIVWAGCHAPPASQRRLFDALSTELSVAGFALERRPWVPHVTLARNVRGDALPELPAPICWQVREFTLVESFLQPSGARYRVLARWPLGESA